VHLIDFHRLGHHPWTGWHWQVKDLAQLAYSSEIAGITALDRARFWRQYVSGAGNTWSTRWLRFCVLQKWRRYRQHNQEKALSSQPSRSEAA